MNKISSTHSSNNTDDLSANDIIDKNIRNLKIKFGIHNISIKTLASNIKSIFLCFSDKYKHITISIGFVLELTRSW